MTTELVTRSKILINYYLKNIFRTIILSDINLSVMTENVESFKEYLCLSTTFLGPVNSAYPLLLNLENDKQTVSVVQQDTVPEEVLQKFDP